MFYAERYIIVCRAGSHAYNANGSSGVSHVGMMGRLSEKIHEESLGRTRVRIDRAAGYTLMDSLRMQLFFNFFR